MKLIRFRFDNFAGLPRGVLTLAGSAGATAGTALVTGGPGAGKTSVLIGLLAAKEQIAPYRRRPNFVERAEHRARPVVVETTWELDDVERARHRAERVIDATVRIDEDGEPTPHDPTLFELLRTYSHDPTRTKVDFFPEHRGLGRAPNAPDRAPTETSERLVRLSDDHRKYNGLWGYFRELAVRGAIEQEAKLRRDGALFADEAGSGLSALASALSKLTDSVTLVGQENESLLFQDRAGRRFGPAGLSASAADALLFAGSLLMVGHQRSMILIDRVDLYRQTSDAVKFIRGLRELVGDSQIIATTSSKELAESGVADCVINLDEAQ